MNLIILFIWNIEVFCILRIYKGIIFWNSNFFSKGFNYMFLDVGSCFVGNKEVIKLRVKGLDRVNRIIG